MLFTVETQLHNYDTIVRLIKFVEDELGLDYERCVIYKNNIIDDLHYLNIFEVTHEELDLLSKYEEYITKH